MDAFEKLAAQGPKRLTQWTMALLAGSALASSAAASEPGNRDAGCLQKLAAAGPVSTFDDAIKALPQIEAKSTYESTADYERRLAAASGQTSRPILLKRTPSYVGEGLSYDADRRILTIRPTAFGAGQINFSMIFGMGPPGMDPFASAIAFGLEARDVAKENYEANNGFGAQVTVTQTTRQVHALWEQHGKRGDSPFLGNSPFKPLAAISMTPQAARDVIERGSVTLLAVPKAPFKKTGLNAVAPDFRRPRERIDQVTALIAYVQCAYLQASDGSVIAAFAVR